MNKKYKELSMYGGTIESVVNKLLEYKEKEELVCFNFNGHMLYSDTVSMDEAYLTIVGTTKEKHDVYIKEENDRIDKENKAHEEKIPLLTVKYKAEGRKVLSEDKWEEWDRIVPIRLGDIYHGLELKASLDIIRVLNNGDSFEKVKNIIENQGHSGTSFSLVCAIVNKFAQRGKDFTKFIDE